MKVPGKVVRAQNILLFVNWIFSLRYETFRYGKYEGFVNAITAIYGTSKNEKLRKYSK